ncbi:hypothetical protein EGW08_005793, partial [Elysia chlorotica]
MDEADRELLRKNHIKLKAALKPAILDVLEYLQSNGIITEPMRERVEYESRVPGDQASKLLHLITTRGKRGFPGLYDAALASNLFDAADILKPECAPHEPAYTAMSRSESSSNSMLELDDLSEDEDLPDIWPLINTENIEQKVRVKSLNDSSKPERLQKKYEHACSPKGQKEIYLLEHKIRGLCLIISNEKFEHLEDRSGTEKDFNDLNMLFVGLGFDVLRFKDKSSNKMEEILRTKVLEANHSNSDCFVLILLSHGENGVVFGTDGKYVNDQPTNCLHVEEIREKVCGVSSLMEKPKLFFLQACRGKRKDKGHTYDGSSYNYHHRFVGRVGELAQVVER